MKIAITGGGGFVGTHVAQILREAGHEVRRLDRYVADDVEAVDVRNEGAVRTAFWRTELVLHLAAVSNTGIAMRFPPLAWEVNVGGTLAVLQAALEAEVPHVVLASSSLVSGALHPMWANWPDDRILWAETPQGGKAKILDPKLDWLVVDEESPLEIARPLHPYVATKLAAEMAVRSFEQAHRERLRTTVLRYGIQYGPAMAPGVLFHTFITRALRGEPLVVDGDGLQWRQYMHVDDLALAHLAVVENLETTRGQTFNLVPHRKVYVKDVAAIIQELIPGTTVEHGPDRQGDIGVHFSVAGKAKSMLGWEAGIDLEEGLEATVDWYRRQG